MSRPRRCGQRQLHVTTETGKPLNPRCDLRRVENYYCSNSSSCQTGRLHDAQHTAVTVLLLLHRIAERTAMGIMGVSYTRRRLLTTSTSSRRSAGTSLSALAGCYCGDGSAAGVPAPTA